jgi:formylglycine-generating enzyme required for sulfatase activity
MMLLPINVHPRRTTALLLLSACLALPLHAQPTLTNDLGMTFVRIEPGSMRVGRVDITCPEPPDPRDVPPEEKWTAEDFAACEQRAERASRPGFTVTIDEPYYIGKYEVTQQQWTAVMDSNPSHFQGDRVEGTADRHPVDNVTWKEARAFVERLSDRDPTATYRLPTEFEWEYAARAGRDSVLSWSETQKRAWILDTNKGTTHPVGRKKPNRWGLHDVLGNVWEWTQDYYNGKLHPDPTPPDTGNVHVLKGGSFISDLAHATYFFHGGGPGNGYDVGFRVVREVK